MGGEHGPALWFSPLKAITMMNDTSPKRSPRTIPREGTPGEILTRRLVTHGNRPAPVGKPEKAQSVFPHPLPFFPSGNGMQGREEEEKSSPCLPNLFIEQGYFLLFKVVYHSIKVAIRLSHIMYSTDSSVTGCNPGCCARVFSGTDRSRF